MKYYSEEAYYEAQSPKKIEPEIEFGCGFCWNKKTRKSNELFFLDNANNMRVCNFCPNCGRKYEEDL